MPWYAPLIVIGYGLVVSTIFLGGLGLCDMLYQRLRGRRTLTYHAPLDEM